MPESDGSPLATRGVPAKADSVVPKQFHDETLQPLWKRAVAGQRKVLFVDAAHFVRGAFLGYLWCYARWVVPTDAGRHRYSVLGILDAVSRALICETTDTEVTVGCLLLKIRDAHPVGPISVVLDNARYQYTAIVRSIAAYARIDLVYLPSYSPKLNLIERVLKFAKKEALANRVVADYLAFKAAIDSTLVQLGTTHHDRMMTLMTHKFETLEPASIIAA